MMHGAGHTLANFGPSSTSIPADTTASSPSLDHGWRSAAGESLWFLGLLVTDVNPSCAPVQPPLSASSSAVIWAWTKVWETPAFASMESKLW